MTFTFGELQEPFLAETVASNDFHIMLYGAGHVGKALINVLSGIECSITWVDNRAEQYTERIPDNTIVQYEDEPEYVVRSAPDKTYYIVMTHCHQLDIRICAHILHRNEMSYCGLIGSETKRRKFEKRLQAKGFAAETLNKLTCPIGISGINSKKPGDIAVAIAGEILRIKNKIIKSRGSKQSSVHQT